MREPARLTLVILATVLGPTVTYGSAVVTVTSPTTPITVQADVAFGGSQSYSSFDTTPFDRSVSAQWYNPFAFSSSASNVRLTFNVTEQEIRSAFDGRCWASGTRYEREYAHFKTSFSLDITVDTLTPFTFDVQTSTTTSPSSPSGGTVNYHFFTPHSNQLDVSFGSNAATPSAGVVTGILLPGEAYRLEFASNAEASGGRPDIQSGSYEDKAAAGSAVLIIPEPASTALLFLGGGICLGGLRRSPYFRNSMQFDG